MTQSFQEIERRLKELEVRFSEIDNLNNFLANQAREYFLLFDSVRKLNQAKDLKSYYKALDKIFRKNFDVDEYSLILKNNTSDLLWIMHSMGLPKRKLREIFYRYNEGLVGKVFSNNRAVYIPDISELKSFNYYDHLKKVRGCIYYMPVTDGKGEVMGVLKMRKILKKSFSEIERSVLSHLKEEIGATYLKAKDMDILLAKSYVDDLTKLYNRRFFEEHYAIEFKRAQRYQHPLSLIFLDVDDFKEINDFLGHTYGDFVLKTIANLVNRLTRSSDICIRYGGDEFLVLLPETDLRAARGVADKLRKAVSEYSFQENGSDHVLEITVSMGISSYPHDTIEPDLLLEMADKALYKAKELGKNQVVLSETL